MPRNISVGDIGRVWTDEIPTAHETRGAVAHPLVLAGSTFVLGLAAGVLVRDNAKLMFERVRRLLWHRAYERTVTYDDNLPETLSRREPAPHEGQPRYGGTGAIGVSPASVVTARPEDASRTGQP